MLSYERYLRMLDELDDLAAALEVQKGVKADTGERGSLDELLAEHRLSRDDLAEIVEAIFVGPRAELAVYTEAIHRLGQLVDEENEGL
jgi:hypothetical protein